MLRKLAEEGRKRRAKRASMMGDSVKGDTSSPSPSSPRKQSPTPAQKTSPVDTEEPEEDEMEKRERELTEKIREAEVAKAKRKAEKRARKSGVFVPLNPLSVEAEEADQTATPIKRPDIFKGLKADEKSSASPKFSFSRRFLIHHRK